jgi:Domain of unknown function (DUF5667)
VSRRRRRERLDRLDAALDGRLVEVDEELAPLVETAAWLRAALGGVELDPEAAERHLGIILDGQAEAAALSMRPLPLAGRWRRRVATVVLAAALTVVPAAMASASALPGQALYPVKLAVEQLQVSAVSWSSTREAAARIRMANTRLEELDRLLRLQAADRIPAAVGRLDQAYVDAREAVQEAGRDTGDLSQVRALDAKLAAVGAALQGLKDRGMVPTGAQQAPPAVEGQPPAPSGLVTGAPPPTPTTAGLVATTIVGSPTTTLAPTTTTTEVPTTTTVSTTTTTVPTTTSTVPTTTLAPTTTTVPADLNDSPDQGGDGDSGQEGSSGETATSLP